MEQALAKSEYIPAVVLVQTNPDLEPTEPRLKLAALARVALGYKELSLACREIRIKLTEQDVADGLRVAGVEVYDNADVCKYKQHMKDNGTADDKRARYGHWRSTLIAEYFEPMPEAAIATALKVKGEISEAEFSVEWYDRADDPFLSFKVPGVRRRFVIEHWDEPQFEGSLRAL